jgi:hypothetical protein
MALGCMLTSVRGSRGKYYENEPLVPQKHTKKKKIHSCLNLTMSFEAGMGANVAWPCSLTAIRYGPDNVADSSANISSFVHTLLVLHTQFFFGLQLLLLHLA